MKKLLILFALYFMIGFGMAYSQGVAINENGNPPNSNAILDVKSSNKGFLPPRVVLDDATTVSPLSGATAGMIIYNEGGAELDGLYMWDGNKWTRFNNRRGEPLFYVGDLYQGGIIFFVDDTGEHGLIASLDDLDGGSGVALSATQATEIGVTAKNFYNGQGNTTAIVAQDGTSGYAATLCDNYSNDGYSDWYLPAQQEVLYMMNSSLIIHNVLENDGNVNTNGLNIADGFAPPYGYYWSSTEYDNTNVRYLRLRFGDTSYGYKGDMKRVRAVRRF